MNDPDLWVIFSVSHFAVWGVRAWKRLVEIRELEVATTVRLFFKKFMHIWGLQKDISTLTLRDGTLDGTFRNAVSTADMASRFVGRLD